MEEARLPHADIHVLQSQLSGQAENTEYGQDSLIPRTETPIKESADNGSYSGGSGREDEEVDSSDDDRGDVEGYVERIVEPQDQIQIDGHRQDGSVQLSSHHSSSECSSDEEKRSEVGISMVDVGDSSRSSVGDAILDRTGSLERAIETREAHDADLRRLPLQSTPSQPPLSQSTWTVAQIPSRPLQGSSPARPRFTSLHEHRSRSNAGLRPQFFEPRKQSQVASKRLV